MLPPLILHLSQLSLDFFSEVFEAIVPGSRGLFVKPVGKCFILLLQKVCVFCVVILNQSWCFRSLCPSVNFAKANNAPLKLSQAFIASFSVGRLSTLSLRIFARVALMSGSALRLLDIQLLLGISFLASLYVCNGKGELDA